MHKVKDLLIDEFTWAFITAAFWTTCEDEFPEYSYSGEFRITPEDILRLDKQSLANMIKTCKDFQESNERLLEQAGSPRRNGHDLWLTSRRHGCGFWDRGYAKDIAEALIKEAHKLDEFSSLVKGDDGKIYLE